MTLYKWSLFIGVSSQSPTNLAIHYYLRNCSVELERAMAAKRPKLDLVEFAARQNQILEQLNTLCSVLKELDVHSLKFPEAGYSLRR